MYLKPENVQYVVTLSRFMNAFYCGGNIVVDSMSFMFQYWLYSTRLPTNISIPHHIIDRYTRRNRDNEVLL